MINLLDDLTINFDLNCFDQGVIGYGIEEVISNATKLTKKYPVGWQLCRGHDLTEMLALHVSNIVGRKVSVREIEEDLRMACELEMINATRFGSLKLRIEKRIHELRATGRYGI